jgi:Tol biopolymer transport system component
MKMNKYILWIILIFCITCLGNLNSLRTKSIQAIAKDSTSGISDQPQPYFILPDQYFNVSQSITSTIQQFYLPISFKNYLLNDFGKIVFVSTRNGNNEIYSMNYDGSAVTQLTYNDSEDREPDWSPDGSKIVFASLRSGSFEIYIMNSDGSSQTQLTYGGRNYNPQWSPDGTKIAFWHQPFNNGVIYLMNSDGSGVFQVTNLVLNVYDPCWMPDGSKLIFRQTNDPAGLYMINTDGTNQALLFASKEIYDFSCDPNGNYIALTLSPWPVYNYDIFLYAIEDNILTRITNTDYSNSYVNWSPSGRRLIFGSNRDDRNNYEIYTMKTDGTDIQRLTYSNGSDYFPDWTP